VVRLAEVTFTTPQYHDPFSSQIALQKFCKKQKANIRMKNVCFLDYFCRKKTILHSHFDVPLACTVLETAVKIIQKQNAPAYPLALSIFGASSRDHELEEMDGREQLAQE